MRSWAVLAALTLAGCAKYQTVQLPPAPGESKEVRWIWKPNPTPVLSYGQPGEFDSVDALNPSIIATSAGYENYYSGWDGKAWRTGLATSKDGIAWQKKGLLLEPAPASWEGGYIAANGAVVGKDYYFQAGNPPQIGLARNAREKLSAPILPAGPRGEWDERGVADPYVIQAGNTHYMFFLGQDRARRQRLGVAISQDGVLWSKSLQNPILELGPPGSFDENGLGEPAVWPQFGKWWMLYTGRDKKEWRRIGIAVSTDGMHWKKVGEKALIDVGEGWNSRVVCDPEVEVQRDGSVKVWFGGGDRPEPAENLHGQIGFGVLRPVFKTN